MKDFLYISTICMLCVLLGFDSRYLRRKIRARAYMKKIDKKEDPMSIVMKQLLDEIEEFRKTGAVPEKKKKKEEDISGIAISSSEMNRMLLEYFREMVGRDSARKRNRARKNMELDMYYMINPRYTKKKKNKYLFDVDDVWGS